jgi:predicted ferric reductase
LLAVNTVQVWWYVTRAAGLMAYLLIWLSTVWGFGVGTKIFDPLLERMFTYDFHEYLSLLGLGFLLTHVVALMADHYQPFNAFQILIPFIAPYRPFWVGIGIIAAYLSILVTITFYIRTLISQQTFRKIHVLSVLAYLGATLHGLYSGTDSPLTVVQLMYWGTFLIAVFLFGYWLVMLWMKKREEQELARQLARKQRYGKGAKAAVKPVRR